MHPTTLEIYTEAKRVASNHWIAVFCDSARHVHVTDGISSAAAAIAKHEVRRECERTGFWGRMPDSARPFAPVVCLTFQSDPGRVGFIVQPASELWVRAFTISKEELNRYPFYTSADAVHSQWIPGTLEKGINKRVSDHERECEYLSEMMGIGVLLSLLNEPRRVEQRPASGLAWSRQYRKSVERITGKAALAYSVVSWQIGAGVKAKNRPDVESDLRLPLHWCRGHWRRAEPHWDGVVWLEPTQGAPAGYYIWIRDCWKGHPDHGIKLQDHRPTMKGEKPALIDCVTAVPSAEKLAAMSAQQRAMMVAAGCVPSGVLH
jgi:hypothetical protein